MGKVKWSFSLIFAIFLVGILSTAAFAASVVYTLKTVQNGTGLEVSFTGNPADGGGYNIVVKDGSNNTVPTGPVQYDSATNIGTLNISSGLTIGKKYTLELDKSDGTFLSNASVLITDGNNTSMPNSNQTGYPNLKKQRTGQKMHGFYQNNTNSCASCHQTHTSKNGDALLFKDGTYDTCTACHDGTTSASPDSISGSFNVSDDVNHGSFHQADGSLQISAAPGGNRTPDTNTGSLGASTWGQDFDCASCHNPHGGGSGDPSNGGENNLNPDPLGWGGVAFDRNAGDVVGKDSSGNPIISTADNKDGKLFKDLVPKTTVPATYDSTKDSPYILVLSQIGNVADIPDPTMKYMYQRAHVSDNSWVLQTYRGDGTNYVADYSLWLRDIGYKGAPFQNANTVLYDTKYSGSTAPDSTHDITAKNMTVVWRDGFAFGSGVSSVASADISIGIDVETTKSVQSLYPIYTDSTRTKISNSSTYIPDSGVEMTKFCAACHTDYLVDPTTGNSGILASTVLNTSYRHSVTDEFTCVRCHYAHGTKSSMMEEKTDQIVTPTGETLSSMNHSSALRRYINDDSCYTTGCHTETIGDPLYLDLSD